MTGHDGYTSYTVRIPTPLYERVKEAAGEASVNSLIVAVLEEKYPEPVVTDEGILAFIARAWSEIPDDATLKDREDLSRRFNHVLMDAKAPIRTAVSPDGSLKIVPSLFDAPNPSDD